MSEEAKERVECTQSYLRELDKRYSVREDDQDPYQHIMSEIVDTIHDRQEQVRSMIARRQDEGAPTGFLEDDLRSLEIKSDTFLTVLVIYNDLKKLNRTERFN